MIDWTLTSATIDSPNPERVADGAALDRHRRHPRGRRSRPRRSPRRRQRRGTAPLHPQHRRRPRAHPRLGRNALGAIDRDQALTAIDTYERDAHTAPVENAADVAGRGRANLEP
ncbi:hypothetical protein GS445_06810 [Rhodococcus hoagii]|nr:hypothetical protein [Prescottella equi]